MGLGKKLNEETRKEEDKKQILELLREGRKPSEIAKDGFSKSLIMECMEIIDKEKNEPQIQQEEPEEIPVQTMTNIRQGDDMPDKTAEELELLKKKLAELERKEQQPQFDPSLFLKAMQEQNAFMAQQMAAQSAATQASIAKLAETIGSQKPAVILPPAVQNQPMQPNVGSNEWFMNFIVEKMNRQETQIREEQNKTFQLLVGNQNNAMNQMMQTMTIKMMEKMMGQSFGPTPSSTSSAPSNAPFWERVLEKALTGGNLDKLITGIQGIGVALAQSGNSYKTREPGFDPYKAIPAGPPRQLPPAPSPLQQAVASTPGPETPVPHQITEDDYLNQILKRNITNDFASAKIIVQTVMKMDDIPDPENKMMLMVAAISNMDYINILATQIGNVQRGEIKIEDIINNLPENVAKQILSRSFDEWMLIARSFKNHPTLQSECNFLLGNGNGTASIVYAAIQKKYEGK